MLNASSWIGLGAALLIGLLIGVERGFRRRRAAIGSRVAGVRTFTLLGLIGGLSGLLAGKGHEGAAAAILIIAGIPLAIGYWRQSAAPNDVSATGVLAAAATLLLGTLASLGFVAEAVASACVITLILASRQQLHGWLSGLSEVEMQAIARFALIVAAVWPFLPAGRFGPFQALDARELWGVVVLVTGFSLAGYVANKHFGRDRGTFVTSALGGLYSSTAVVAALSNQLRADPEARLTITAGIAIASAVMFARVLVLTALLAPVAWTALAIVLLPAAVVAGAIAVWTLRVAARNGAQPGPHPQSVRNPVELAPALGFAVLVAVTAIGTRWAESRFGGAGAATAIMITGSFDVDVAIVTLGGLPKASFTGREAGLILAVPVLANTLFKAFIVLLTGGTARWSGAAPLLGAAGLLVVALLISAAV